eukprot:gene8161-biopygen10624
MAWLQTIGVLAWLWASPGLDFGHRQTPWLGYRPQAGALAWLQTMAVGPQTNPMAWLQTTGRSSGLAVGQPWPGFWPPTNPMAWLQTIGRSPWLGYRPQPGALARLLGHRQTPCQGYRPQAGVIAWILTTDKPCVAKPVVCSQAMEFVCGQNPGEGSCLWSVAKPWGLSVA